MRLHEKEQNPATLPWGMRREAASCDSTHLSTRFPEHFEYLPSFLDRFGSLIRL